MVDERFVGAWRLVSFVFQNADGSTSEPFGAHPQGYIFYSADGFMSVMFMRADRPHFTSPDVMGGSLEEKVQAMESFFSYCGTYEIQGNEVVHHIEVSLFPNWSGLEVRRYYRFEGRQLTLNSAPQLFQGQERTALLVWEQAAA